MDSLHRSGVCTLEFAEVGNPWLFNQESSSAHLQLDLDPYTGSLHNGEEGKRALNYCHPALGHTLQMGHQSTWLKDQQRDIFPCLGIYLQAKLGYPRRR